MALAAAARGDYETFHDLAWRAIQTGPPKDPALMFLLARAQALSGRPHDALIMLQRLAEMGVPSDVVANDEFARTRELPGWPEVSALIERLTHPDSHPRVSSAAVTSSPAAKVPTVESPSDPTSSATATSPPANPSPSTLSPSPSSGLGANSVRFSTDGFTLGGLAYDAVSRRFVVGDRLGRKLMVVADGANHAVDFVRAASAGFRDITAIEIDDRRGDLWVVSAATPADGAATLHKLQLVSGRPLKSFPIAAGLEPVTIVDLAVTPAGAVLVLDSGGRLLALPPGGTAVEAVMKIDTVEPVSLAVGSEPGIAYVAHRDGVSRVDLRARTATRVTAPGSISLAHLGQLRWRRHALFAIRGEPDGTHRIFRLDLNASGRAVTRSTTLEGPIPLAGQTFVAISGDELVYMVDSSKDAVGRPDRGASGTVDFVAYRLPLR